MSDPGAASWYHEKESAWLYRKLAAAEPLVQRRQLFEALGHAAEQQAEHWAPSLHPRPVYKVRLRARIVAALLRVIEPRHMRGVLAAMKLRGLSVYSAAPLAAGHLMPVTVEDVGLRHRGTGGNLRAAVFGVNDGLISNTSLLMGMAGAGASSQLILLTGTAGLLAGALSMAAGEYLSVRSQREMYEYQIGLERDELAEYPQEEAEELALIYAARGMPLAQARAIALDLVTRPAEALDALAREELGLDPDGLGVPWGAAIASFLSFGAGACLPLLPFLLGATGRNAALIAGSIAAVALLAVGSILSLFTGRHALWGALRMLGIGASAALLTGLIGRAFGLTLSP
ncbi:MAG: VIT1/CCC1 transporter family protein [Steroidobacteraceae bacterium]